LVNSKLFLYTPNDPIVESSSGLTIAPYNFRYPFLKQHALDANLVGQFTDDDGVIQNKINKWSYVFDFTKREDGELNYSLVQPSDFSIIDCFEIVTSLQISLPNEDDSDYLFELPKQFGGSLDN
jgi:hypothetical protein